MKTVVISAVRDFDMHARCVKDNPFCRGCEIVAIDNRESNDGIGVCYNRFLDSRPQDEDAWYVFCHEDFEPKESLADRLGSLDPSCLWGPIGAETRVIGGIYHQWRLLGSVEECKKDGSNRHTIGTADPFGTPVETFDCQCLIVHSSLIRKRALRFDKTLTFDLYVEDFCIAAHETAAIPSRILPFAALHWSGGSVQPRYYQQEAYLNAKYPTSCYTGTSSWILGGNPPFFRRLTVAAKRLLKAFSSFNLKDFCYNTLADSRNRRVSKAIRDPNQSVKIAVVRHFDCTLPPIFNDSCIFLPIWCGQSSLSAPATDFRDNAGDNVSSYNPFLNEATALYWIGKHYEEIGNPDYVGINHYRRHLQWSAEMLRPGTIIATSFVFIQRNRDLICFHLDKGNRDKLLAFLSNKMEQAGYADFKDYLNSHVLYAYNMFVTDRETFRRYFGFIEPFIWLFTRLIDEKFLPLDNAPATEKRIYGYMLEHLTSYWIFHERRTKSSRIITTRVDNFDVRPRS